MIDFDVAVIGAGVHGASAAFHLASSGARVVVLDRWPPAGGPTGRSSAVCRAYYTNEFLARCARDSIAMMDDFERVTGYHSGYRRIGAVFLHPREDEPAMREAVARLNELGIVTEVLTKAEIVERFPVFDLAGIGVGAFERDAGYADPAATTMGLYRAAVARGAEGRLGVEVTALEERPGGWTVTTKGGDPVAATRLLVAAGPWTRGLALTAGVDLPIHVERHIVATFRWDGAPHVPMHADIVGGYYFRPEGSELFLVGPLHAAPEADPDDFSPRVTEDEVRELSEAVVRRSPGLDRSTVHGGWASLYDVSPDWQPVIGEVAPGLFVDAGTSGHGFKLAPALGRHVADLVLGERWDPGIDQFHPNRFSAAASLAAGYGDARILG
jgi:glycine/D-amino acid oxidase-like deaminating enzyme